MRIIFIVIISIMVAMSTSFAFAESRNFIVMTDNAQYSMGEKILVYGKTQQILFGQDVVLMIFAPNGDLVIMDSLKVDSKGEFQTQLKNNNSLMALPGSYVVQAMYGEKNNFAESTFEIVLKAKNQSVTATEKKVLLNFDFVNPTTNKIQEHVDYKITVSKNNVEVFSTPSISHSSSGKVSIPINLSKHQTYDVLIQVYGISFTMIPSETSSFRIMSEGHSVQSNLTSDKILKVKLGVDKNPSLEKKAVPEWVKNNSKWWAAGLIQENEFTNGLEYLIQEKIIKISNLPHPASWMDKNVPSWVKNNALWWGDDLISDDEFVKGIKFLVEKGIIQV